MFIKNRGCFSIVIKHSNTKYLPGKKSMINTAQSTVVLDLILGVRHLQVTIGTEGQPLVPGNDG